MWVLVGLASLALSAATALFTYEALSSIVVRSRRGTRLLEQLMERYPGMARNRAIAPVLWWPLVGVFLDAVERARLRGSGFIWRQLIRTDRDLSAAGIQPNWEPRVAVAYRMVLASLTVAGGVLLSFPLLLLGAGIIAVAVLLLTPPMASWVFQSMLKDQIDSRKHSLERELPYTLEFLSMMMHANATLEGALQEYCSSMAPTDAMASELRLTLRDLRYGLGVKQAFHALRTRVHSEPIAALTFAVEHGVEQGQSLKQVLAEQSHAVKVARFQSAERLAKTAAAKGVLPSLLAALACMLVLLGPILIRMLSTSLF